VHDCKLKVDGITKYLDNTEFAFDYAFDENVGTEDVYLSTTQPLVDFILRKGRATVFAYGQTGSGKTYTMAGIQEYVAQDLFAALDQDDSHGLIVGVSFFEIYGGRCQDLLNHRHRLEVREDGKGEVNIAGLEEVEVRSYEDLLGMIELGNRNRTTHATEANDVSSRSHAICQVTLRSAEDGKVQGKLSLIDLAGSERAADTRSHNRQRRMEGAEINKSLLALKECIRALDNNSGHVPYRASKLTLVLKDSFTNRNAKTVMIATVSPTASSADHTLNTLRYADRVKEKSVDLPLPIDLASKGTKKTIGMIGSLHCESLTACVLLW
jgi:kinesin family protein 2/24